MKFPCTACGACCRNLPGVTALNRGDGTCRHLDDVSGLCSVYDSRPEMCRIDRYYETRLRDRLDRKVYYTIQALSCVRSDSSCNAGILERTLAALREAGYDGEPLQLDARQIAEATAVALATLGADDLDGQLEESACALRASLLHSLR